MPLPMDKTTRLTEAVENGTKELKEVATEISQLAEQLISDATRSGGTEATAADLVVNAARLANAWFAGMARLAITASDNLSLITDPIPNYWVSGNYSYPHTPGPGARWLLKVVSAFDQMGKALAPEAIALYANGMIASTNAAAPTPVDETWDGTFVARPRGTGYIPGAIRLVVVAVDPVTGKELHVPVDFPDGLISRDPGLVGT